MEPPQLLTLFSHFVLIVCPSLAEMRPTIWRWFRAADILDGHENGTTNAGYTGNPGRTCRKALTMTTRSFLSVAAVVGATLIFGSAAFAQGSSCANREMIVDRLQSKYGESRQSAGLNQNNGMVEVFASTETGTWTILVTMPNGMSCLMAAGKSWQGMVAATETPGQGV